MKSTEICEALFEALASGEEETVRSLCAPDVRAIQNGGPPMDLDQLLRFTRAVFRVVADVRDGKVSELREYLDGLAARSLTRALA
jgi:ketosteroid isomerase-like protein